MTDYCTLEDACELTPRLPISATSTPTTTQATNMVADVASEIEMALASAGVSLPVTDDRALIYLNTVNKQGAAAAILRAAFGSGEMTDGAAADWEKKYQANLVLIRGGGLSPLAPATTTSFAHGFSTEAYDADEAPY